MKTKLHQFQHSNQKWMDRKQLEVNTKPTNIPILKKEKDYVEAKYNDNLKIVIFTIVVKGKFVDGVIINLDEIDKYVIIRYAVGQSLFKIILEV